MINIEHINKQEFVEVKSMVKKALKSAIGVSIGVTIGGVVLPRIFFSERYNETWPPILEQTLLYFAVGYATCFLVALLIEGIKTKMKNES